MTLVIALTGLVAALLALFVALMDAVHGERAPAPAAFAPKPERLTEAELLQGSLAMRRAEVVPTRSEFASMTPLERSAWARACEIVRRERAAQLALTARNPEQAIAEAAALAGDFDTLRTLAEAAEDALVRRKAGP